MLSFTKALFKTLICLAIILTAGALSTAVADSGKIGIIRAHRLNMRPDPARNNTPIVVLKKGVTVQIMDDADIGDWLKIKYQGQIGFIRNRPNYVQIIVSEKSEPADPAKEEVQPVLPEQTSKPVQISEKKSKQELAEEIEQQKAELVEFTQQESLILNGLNDIDLAINKARGQILELRTEIQQINQALTTTTRQYNELLKSIGVNEVYANNRLVALYKLNRIGSLNLLASAESMQSFFQRKAALEKILSYDEQVLKQLVEDKIKSEALKETLISQKNEKTKLEEDFNNQIGIMRQERAKREQLLADIRNKHSMGLAALHSLEKAALMLDAKIRETLKIKKGLKKPKKLQNFSTDNLGSLKGLLRMPVKGKIINFFGPYKNEQFNTMNFRSGIDIKADRGEPIQAVHEGEVLFSDWFKGYGNMIIIDHGDHFYTVYAHTEEVFKKKGDKVKSGEVIATVGDTGSLIGPGLYFEVRHHGKPLNPRDWINTNKG